MESSLISVCAVGGNAVSAFLSWRLQATNACDVTLVWKSGFDQVSQYGISMRSKVFGNERFKPRHVVRTPEEASGVAGAFDYVLLCVKALPDVYDLAAVVESVVTPQHTCILLNTTNTLGIESQLEQRFSTNIVLSLVSEAEVTQLGASEFEHHGSSEIWVGPANRNPSIPAAIQSDMAEALAMTLASGQVDCKVSDNIRQQQYERMIGPIAFHPLSVLFETPSHPELMAKIGVRSLVDEVIDELVQIASTQDCHFPDDFKQRVIETMTRPTDIQSIMYQDFMARRPMEVETYLGMPIKLAHAAGLRVPRIETLYALVHHVNLANQSKPLPMPPHPGAGPYPPRMSSGPFPRPMMNGHGPRMSRPPQAGQGQLPPPPPSGGMMRRGPPPGVNGRPPMGNGYPPRPPPAIRRVSADPAELEEFGHLMLYDNIPEDEIVDGPNKVYPNGANGHHAASSSTDLALREREFALRQREMALREHELQMRRGGGRRALPSQVAAFDDDDDDEDGEYFEPSRRSGGPARPVIDPENFDMMSVTSRRARKAPSASQLRKNPELRNGAAGGRPGLSKNRVSARMMQDIPGLHESLMNNPLMGFSSNRYGTVDRKAMADESRSNSLTAARLEELQQAGGVASGGVAANGLPSNPAARRTSQSPGNPYGPGPGGPRHGHPQQYQQNPHGPGMNRPSPPAGYGPTSNGLTNGYGPTPTAAGGGYGPPSPIDGPNGTMREPTPRYPVGQGNQVAPQQVEQRAGVSHLRPPLLPPKVLGGNVGGFNAVVSSSSVRSLTGSASASAESGDLHGGSSTSGASARIESSSVENSASSSQSSLGAGGGNGIGMAAKRMVAGVR